MAPMSLSTPLSRWWSGLDGAFDRVAIGISGLCLIHCIATTVLLTIVSTAGGLLDPHIHEYGLVLAIGFGIYALGRGIVHHGYMAPAAVGAFGLGIMSGALSLPHGGFETIWTLIGVSLVALGHDLNRRATY
ncbi:MerC domain-containing protein [Sphingomonas sp. ABOLD]|uniref:MerC domain-containing protein n=2 Tax=Sphingomonadaceae TaxID=41297 RepID=UPI000F7E9327|nr:MULTISPECIES: MerC domain-containing protein [Sphingomonas]RSV44448.1 MerC domain-containing protein [Sphingomonas sp. ABOLE]RSV51897.1 MerC domain-containing protein [Sphingomonas sp. ABOLD]